MEKKIKEKRCPKCERVYVDETLNYCLADGSFLFFPEEFEAKATEAATEVLDTASVRQETASEFNRNTAKETEIKTEVLEFPTEVRQSIPTIVIPKTEPAVIMSEPAPVEKNERFYNPPPAPRQQDSNSRNFLLLGGLAGFVLLIILTFVFLSKKPASDKVDISIKPPSETNTAANSNATAFNTMMATNASNKTNTANNVSASATPDNLLGNHDDARFVGTTWRATDSNGEKHTTKFLSDGKIEYKSNNSTSDGNDRWGIKNDRFIINYSGNYATCEAPVNEKLMIFQCVNENNFKWKEASVKIK